MKSYVFSHSQPPGERGGVTFVNDSLKVSSKSSASRSGKNIWLMGAANSRAPSSKRSGRRALYRIVPVLIGEGLPLFPSAFPQREFSLLENKTSRKA